MSVPTAPSTEFRGIKDALVHAGLLDKDKAGRGRPSRQMLADAETLVKDYGYRIAGYSVKSQSAAAKTQAEIGVTPAPKEVQKTAKTSGKEIVEVIPQTRGDDLVPIVNGKPWKMGIRGLCETCRVSLTHCPCVTAIVRLDYKTTAPVESYRTKA